MPVTTVNSDGTTVTVTVTNSQPSGNRHTVGAYLCWNPAYLEMEDPDPASAKVYNNYGFCVWYGHEIAVKKSLPFKLKVKKVKKSGITWFVGCSMDPVLGIYSEPDREDVVVETKEDAKARVKAEEKAKADKAKAKAKANKAKAKKKA